MKQYADINSVSTFFYMLVHQPLVPSSVQAPPCSDCIAIHNKGIGRLNLTTWFMLLMTSKCIADGEARDIVNQANQPHSETGALTPEQEDEYQLDMCPLPFTVWFGGTARLCLLLACACCIFIQHSGQPSDFSMQAAVQRISMSFVMHWCMMLSVQFLKQRATNQMTSCFGRKAICEGYGTVTRTVYLLSCLRQPLSGLLSLLLLLVLLYAGASPLV